MTVETATDTAVIIEAALDRYQLTKSMFGQLPTVPADCMDPVVQVRTDESFDDEICVIGSSVIDGSLVRAEVMVWDERAPRLRPLPVVELEA